MYIKINQYLKTVNEWNMLNKLLKKCFYSIFNSYTLIDIRTNDRLNATEFKKKILDKQWLRDNYYHLFWQCSKQITKMSYWRKKIKIFYFSLFFLERGGGEKEHNVCESTQRSHVDDNYFKQKIRLYFKLFKTSLFFFVRIYFVHVSTWILINY